MSEKVREKVLFVCTANICRSPTAAGIFNDLASGRDLPFVAESAGVFNRGGQEMAPLSREALAEIGIEAHPHKSRRMSAAMMSDFDLILAMEPRHVSKIEEDFGESGKVSLLSAYATSGASDEEIADPYGLTIFAYRASVRQLYYYVTKTLDRMSEDSSPV